MIDRPLDRAAAFREAHGLGLPVLMAPMAGACPPALAAAVGRAGGMGACGALTMDSGAIAAWAREVRAATDRPFLMNLWVPDPAPARDPAHEATVSAFLGAWGPPPGELAATLPIDFADQCEALLEARPAAVSSIMGLFPEAFVERARSLGIRWFATATTVGEAVAAAAAGADAIVAQGMEAGGHRGAFEAERAGERLVGLVSLVPAIVDAVDVPVVAAGGIGDARGAAAALALGASAIQIGTVSSGRLGRSLATEYVVAANAPGAPAPLPYPLQRSATTPMRAAAAREGDVARTQAWAGQSAGLAEAAPAGRIVETMWAGARRLLGD